MTSKQKIWYGYWSAKQANTNGYFLYNSAQGPVKVTEVNTYPPEIALKNGCLKGSGHTLDDFKCVGKVTDWLSSDCAIWDELDNP